MYPLLRSLEQRGLVDGPMGAPRAAQSALLSHHPGGEGRARAPGSPARAHPGCDRDHHRPAPSRAARRLTGESRCAPGRRSEVADADRERRPAVSGNRARSRECWYDTRRWPAWVDGLDRVVDVAGDWPQAGASVTWESGPAGRGRVIERVVSHEALAGQTLEVQDDSITGSPERHVHAGGRRRRGGAEPRVRDQEAIDLHAAGRPAVHPARDGDIAEHDAGPVRRRAGQRASSGVDAASADVLA